ncbi:hypothetical protein F2Q69_00009053 [Brassica cretica]|uniref:Uncharacterized protein n=2 Tax=Brassica cretica TaxID=69181 RepID=A0A8S9NWD6_BRACR|nr:hypothetical protein F2Q69_00009053 [Brassica cretica]
MKRVCYGFREIALKSRRECMDSCCIDVSGKLDRFVTIKTCTCSVALARARSLRSDRAVCMLGRCIAIVLGLSVVRSPYSSLYVAGLDTCPLPWDSRDLFREFSAVCKLVGFLKTLEYWPRDKFWDLVSECLILCLEMLETSALGLGQDLGLITALEGAMTTSSYVSRIVFDLIPSSFKVRDMFSAYVTCMILPFLSLREEYVFEKMFSMYDCLVFQEGFSLSPAFEKHSGLSTDVRSQNYCSCLDLICDRGVRTKGSRKFVPEGSILLYRAFRQVIGAVVAQLFWLCMKAVLSFIAKDVVAKGLDHDTFVLSIREIKPKKLDTEPVRSQLRGDFLLGRDQAE